MFSSSRRRRRDERGSVAIQMVFLMLYPRFFSSLALRPAVLNLLHAATCAVILAVHPATHGNIRTFMVLVVFGVVSTLRTMVLGGRSKPGQEGKPGQRATASAKKGK